MSQSLEPPSVFPARVNGQRSMVVVTRTQIKWHPAPTEVAAARIDGGVVDIANIAEIGGHDLGPSKVLRLATSDAVIRMLAASDLIDRVRRHVECSRAWGGEQLECLC